MVWANKGLAVLALFVSGCGQGPVLRTQEYWTSDGSEKLMGDGCVSTDRGAKDGMGSGVAPGGDPTLAPSFLVEYEGTGDGVHFVARDEAGVELAERNYDAAFLASAKHDEIAIEPGGFPMRLVHWGEKSCDLSATEPAP